MPPRKLNLQQLQAKWYKKLKDEGFKDIEHNDGSVNSQLPYVMRARHQVYQDSVREYYQMCQAFANEHDFATERERVIWTYHTEGLSTRQIAETLRKAKVCKMSKSTVSNIVRKLEAQMKAKYLSV